MTENTETKILAECLDWIEKTGGSIQEAAARYPDHAEEIIGLLQTYQTLNQSEKISPTAEFAGAARTRMINRIQAVETTSQPGPVTKQKPFRLIWRNKTGNRRFAMNWLLIIGLIVGLIGGGGGAAYASSDSLPGDLLYPVKTGLQAVELAFSDDISDIDILLENMTGNIEEMQQLALKQRYSDMITGLEEYEGNLQALTRTRARISYDDAGSENSLNQRIQEQLQIHAQLLNQLREQTQEQTRLQERLQQAIQLTGNGHTYGPNEGGMPDEPGTPNGAGPGEPQGPQEGSGKPEDAGSGNGESGEPGKGPGPGGNPDTGSGTQNQNSYGDGDGMCSCLENENLYCVMGEVQDEFGDVVDAVCTCHQSGLMCGEGEYQYHNQNQSENQNQSCPDPGPGSPGNGQGGKP